MAGKYTRADCIALLNEKQRRINESGESRFPKRGDFPPEEVVAIKAFLGPWPRALEAAGIKKERGFDRLEKNREKRARAEKRQRQAKKAAKAAEKANHETE